MSTRKGREGKGEKVPRNHRCVPLCRRTKLNVKLASLISLYDEYNPGPRLVRRKLIRAREEPGLASSPRGTLIFELAAGVCPVSPSRVYK